MFKHLLCAIALVSAAFAQDLNLVLPKGTSLKAGSDINILLSSSADISQDLGIVVAASTCLGGCPDPHSNGLGTAIYTGRFENHQNVTVKAPNWFNGQGVLSVAHFYTDTFRNIAKVDVASTKITVSASG